MAVVYVAMHAVMHGDYAWLLRMSLCMSLYMAVMHGRHAWLLCMAVMHGRYAWSPCMAAMHGCYVWPLCMAVMHVVLPCCLSRAMYRHAM